MHTDTAPRALEAQLAALRARGPSERMAMAIKMSEDARCIAIEGEQRRHPELTYDQARSAVVERSVRAAMSGR